MQDTSPPPMHDAWLLPRYGAFQPYVNNDTDWMPEPRQPHMPYTWPPPAPHQPPAAFEFPGNVYEKWSGDPRLEYAPNKQVLQPAAHRASSLSGDPRLEYAPNKQMLQAAAHPAMAFGAQVEPGTTQLAASAVEFVPHYSYSGDFMLQKQGSNKIPWEIKTAHALVGPAALDTSIAKQPKPEPKRPHLCNRALHRDGPILSTQTGTETFAAKEKDEDEDEEETSNLSSAEFQVGRINAKLDLKPESGTWHDSVYACWTHNEYLWYTRLQLDATESKASDIHKTWTVVSKAFRMISKPPGIRKKDWKNMSQEEKDKARRDYAEISKDSKKA